jgi:hypothetical protein
MGNFAPFHSQKQKSNTTKTPDNKGARTTADVQGNVTPPYPGKIVGNKHIRLHYMILTQMRGRMISVHPISVSPAPR